MAKSLAVLFNRIEEGEITKAVAVNNYKISKEERGPR